MSLHSSVVLIIDGLAMKILALTVFSLMMFLTSQPVNAGQKEELIQFLRAFELQQHILNKTGKQINWSLARYLPPWGPYTLRQYSEGLHFNQRRRMPQLARKGDCAEIRKLELLGFLMLYPQLTPALARKDVREVFDHYILPSTSLPYIYCRSLNQLNSTRQELIGDIEIPLNYYQTETIRAENSQKAGYKAFQNLRTLGLCALYAPAIVDLLRLSQPMNKLYIPEDERFEYYNLIRDTEFEIELDDLTTGSINKGTIELPTLKKETSPNDCVHSDPRLSHYFILED